MEEADHSYYVAQLKAEFDSCDTTASGFLDREDLTVLCRKLQLDAHLPLLLDTLLSERPYGRVNFEQFKDGFVAVLSRSLDFSTSEDDSSYLEPAVPEEVRPKFVKGTKRYGRRSHPDKMPEDALTSDPEKSLSSKPTTTDLSPAGVRRAKLRRSTSLESVESLKSDEDVGRQRDNVQPQDVEQQVAAESHRVKEEHGEPGVSERGALLAAVCHHLGRQPLNALELDVLLQKLDADLDGRASLKDFQMVLCSSTPKRPADLQRALLRSQVDSGEPSQCSTAPSLLTATVGCRVLSQLDDGSGCTSPEQVVALWMEEGIRNSRDILQTLDFPLEERLSLADLTLALDNELLVSGNSIHQAALISYKSEIEYLQVLSEQACRERDKVKSDLDLAEQRNLQLVREVDDHHASMETSNKNRIRDLEQEYRDRLAALRSQSDQDSEVLLQQVDRERSVLQDELQLLQTRNVDLQEDIYRITQENARLEEELNVVKLKLSEAESRVTRLHRDLDQLLHNKFGNLDPSGAGLSHEERLCEVVREYELQCRELRDRNDELSSELAFLKSHTSTKKSRRSAGDEAALNWTEGHSSSADSDPDDTDLKRGSSSLLRDQVQPEAEMAQRTVDSVSGPAVSIQTELALEQLKQKHSEELQQLHIQMDTQVNYYERSLEMMRQSMEVERKDISQAFKMEISELEEQKAQAEQQAKQLKEALDKLHVQSAGGAGGWTPEQQRRMQRDRAELEQNFAREISNLVQKLSVEKDQLEAELKLKMDQEVMLVRMQLEEVRSENCALKERLGVLQKEIQNLEDDMDKKTSRLEETEREHKKSREEEERLHKENSKYREEFLDLSNRNLQLSSDNAELSASLRANQESVRTLQEHLTLQCKEQEEGGATVRRLQDAATEREREKLHRQTAWQQERHLLERELNSCKEKIEGVAKLKAELKSVTVKQQQLEEDKAKLLRDADAQNHKVEELEVKIKKLIQDKEDLRLNLDQEIQKLRVQNQYLQNKLSEQQVQSLEVQRLTQEQQNLKTKLNHLEVSQIQAQDQAVRADAALSVAQAQHVRKVQELRDQAGEAERDHLDLLQARLAEEQRRNQQLEDTLKVQISLKQDQYEKAMSALQQRMEDLESKLKTARLLLQDKVQQLKDQLVKNNKLNALTKDLYVENSQLLSALQVTEQRQKNAEKKNLTLEDKINALHRLLRDTVSASLAT